MNDPRLLEYIASPGNEPTLIGRGGSQLVYKYPGMSELIKVDYATLSMPDINGNALQALAPTPEIEPAVHATLALRTTIKQAAEDCLGRESFLNDQVSFMPFALSGRMCRELWGSTPYPDNQIRWFRTFVTFQEEAQPLVHPERYGTVPLFVTSYEKSPQARLDHDLYGTAMRRWVTCTDPTLWQDSDWELLAQLDGEHIRTFREHIQQDDFRDALQRFVSGAIAFSNLTGQHIDIGGPDNVVFYRDGNAVRYLNVDPLIPLTDDVLSFVQNGIHTVSNRQPIGNDTAKWMLNALGSVRTINALAQALGLPERIQVTRWYSFVDNATWRDILYATRSVRLQGHNFPTQWHTASFSGYGS